MRRVDEAIRQVLGEAIAGELKDPRVGFVTVTDVRTSVDLRHARVYVSVLDDALAGAVHGARRGGSRGDARGPAQRPWLPAGADRGRAAPEADADARVRLRRDDRPGVPRRCADRRDGSLVSEAARPRARARADPRADPRGLAVRARHPREARRRRARLAGRDAGSADRARQDLCRCSSRPRTCRFRASTDLFPLDGLIQARPGRHRRAHRHLPRLRQHRPQLRRACCGRAATC